MDNKEAARRIREHMIVHMLREERAIFITEALDKAIASLEAWDKVKEDISHSQFIFLDGDKEIECIPIFEVINIINRNLGGEVAKNDNRTSNRRIKS